MIAFTEPQSSATGASAQWIVSFDITNKNNPASFSFHLFGYVLRPPFLRNTFTVACVKANRVLGFRLLMKIPSAVCSFASERPRTSVHQPLDHTSRSPKNVLSLEHSLPRRRYPGPVHRKKICTLNYKIYDPWMVHLLVLREALTVNRSRTRAREWFNDRLGASKECCYRYNVIDEIREEISDYM